MKNSLVKECEFDTVLLRKPKEIEGHPIDGTTTVDLI